MLIELKHNDDFWTWSGTIIVIIISFYLMIMTRRKLPVATFYTLFVRLGTAGKIFSDVVFFRENI